MDYINSTLATVLIAVLWTIVLFWIAITLFRFYRLELKSIRDFELETQERAAKERMDYIKHDLDLTTKAFGGQN